MAERLSVYRELTSRGRSQFAAPFGCAAVYAFVHFADDRYEVRFENALTVENLAEEDERAYAGTNRFHLNFDQLPPGVYRPYE